MLEPQQGATVLEWNEQGRVEGDGVGEGTGRSPVAEPLGLWLWARRGVVWLLCRGQPAEGQRQEGGWCLGPEGWQWRC